MIKVSGRFLITGGTGSLGKATLIRANQEGWDADFIIFSRDETKQGSLRKEFPQYRYFLGDVAKYSDIDDVVRGTKPDAILHYAAYKQVPAAQNNVNATIATNVQGSQNVVRAALAHNVKQVIASSTDKACQCVNAYGAAKNLMECIFQDANKWNSQLSTFNLARYGNVVSSNSSVIPFFKQQIKAGGPVTITDFRMVRFWISLWQAVELILEAGCADPGVIVVPKAPIMNILDVAKYLIREADKEEKIEIKDIGIRPGEKIHECMVSEAESFHTIDKGKYFHIYPPNAGVFNPSAPFSYTTENADRQLTDKQMAELIRKSKELGS